MRIAFQIVDKALIALSRLRRQNVNFYKNT